MNIIDLTAENASHVEQVAALLVEGFRDFAPTAWPTLASARAEVYESFQPERVSRIALDDDDMVLGWIGGVAQYRGHVWELHPLVVKATEQGHGIGRALVHDLEAHVIGYGGHTITLGTDDEDNRTSLSGVNLYPNVADHIQQVRNLRGHPFEFYQKLGFVITGIIPDANGPGKPDIIMCKRVC